jgi:hypothetical protein
MNLIAERGYVGASRSPQPQTTAPEASTSAALPRKRVSITPQRVDVTRTGSAWEAVAGTAPSIGLEMRARAPPDRPRPLAFLLLLSLSSSRFCPVGDQYLAAVSSPPRDAPALFPMDKKRPRSSDSDSSSVVSSGGGEDGARRQAGGFGTVTAAELAKRKAELHRQSEFVRCEVALAERMRMEYLAGQSDFFKCVRGAGGRAARRGRGGGRVGRAGARARPPPPPPRAAPRRPFFPAPRLPTFPPPSPPPPPHTHASFPRAAFSFPRAGTFWRRAAAPFWWRRAARAARARPLP